MNRECIMHIEGLSIGYGGNILCQNIGADILPGDSILLCGANGSGKTTLLRALAAMPVKPTSDARTSMQTGRTAMVPSGIPKVKGFTLEGFIATSLYRQTSWRGAVGESLRTRIERSCEAMGIAQLRGRDIFTLSDGEFQKATVAAALCRAGEGGCVLLDEPTAYLDPENKAMVFEALRKAAGELSCAFVCASHDIAPALESCNCVWAIGRDGKFRASRGETEEAGAETKKNIISSIFSDKSLTFGKFD